MTIEGAKAVIEARLVGSSQPGEHELLIVEVPGSRILEDSAKPMVHLRKSGLHCKVPWGRLKRPRFIQAVH